MSGLSRFDFFPRDWFLDTRDLSNEAKGFYIDLLAAMYARGGPIKFDENEVCRIVGFKSTRPLKRLLKELVGKGKVRLIDGCLTNGRAMEEIAQANARIEKSQKGGKASAKIVSGKDAANLDETSSKLVHENKEKQGDNHKYPSSPPPNVSSKEEDTSPDGLRSGHLEINEKDSNTEPFDQNKVIFGKQPGSALVYLTTNGVSEKNARSMLGRWRSEFSIEAVIEAVKRASDNTASEPVAFIQAVLNENKDMKNGKQRNNKRHSNTDNFLKGLREAAFGN
jgi:uncharacterized protein YdaU (DUF1376 family)